MSISSDPLFSIKETRMNVEYELFVMESSQEIKFEIRDLVRKLSYGHVTDDIYKAVCMYPAVFSEMGITPEKIADVLELKAKVAFLPDALAYSLLNPDRSDYLITNCDNPSVSPLNLNENKFLSALRSHYHQESEYKNKLEELSQIAKEGIEECWESSYYKLNKSQETGLLIDIVLNRGIEQYPFDSVSEKSRFLSKFDLYDVYHLEDGIAAFKLKAGEALETKHLLAKGTTERILNDAGFSVEQIKESLRQYNIDKLRVSYVDVYNEGNEQETFIQAKVDGVNQEVRKLSAFNISKENWFSDYEGMAVRCYKDILDMNREQGRMIVNEKDLERAAIPYIDRLVDIYRNGLSESDERLFEAATLTNTSIDSFWMDIPFSWRLDKDSDEAQKEAAFIRLVDNIEGLRPGMLTDEEIIRAIKVPMIRSSKGREEELMLMKLPECFFPLIEKCGEYDRGVIDYVKVLRDIGRTTPTMAYNSMDYFLSHRLYTEWDPAGADDEFGEVVGGYYYPNEGMNNPAEEFVPNLLNEQQWRSLYRKYSSEAAEFIPRTAFRKNRIDDVQVYSTRNGGMMIRCKVDDEQQSAKHLSFGDASRYRVNSDVRRLAVGYFMDAFARDSEKELSLQR